MTRTLATLSLFGLAGGVLAAPETAPPPRAAEAVTAPAPRAVKPLAVADGQELVVYAPHRPVRVRLSVQLEGKSVAEMWREKLRAAFTYFDRDGDGSLNTQETPNVFSDQGVSIMLQNGFYQPTPQDRPTVARLDADADGKVSFDEYAAYYKNSTAALFRPQPTAPEYGNNTAVTNALFKLLDANGDEKLTKDEVKAVEKMLATKDADEDECLSQVELVPNQFDPRFGRPVFQSPSQPQPAGAYAANHPVMTFEPGRIPGTVTQQVIKRYDRDGDFDLTRAEAGFDEQTFVRLDADGNGKLDGEEMDAWRTGPADLDVALSLAPKAVDCTAKVTTDRGVVADRGFSVKQVENGRVVIRVGRQPIEFWAFTSAVGQYQQPALKAQYQYLFQQPAGTKGFVEEKDFAGPNAVQFQFLRTIFDAADADGDKKLTRAEFDGYFDLQDTFRNVGLAVTPAVQTPSLFQLLDENRDGRLGVRELRTSWDRLLALEPGTDGTVTRAAIQPSVSFRLSRAMDRYYVNQQQYVYQNPNQVPVPTKGPLWFRKMDRNACGDVSRSEFLGTKAEFDAIDTDKDDLISLDEAEAFDKKMRVVEK